MRPSAGLVGSQIESIEQVCKSKKNVTTLEENQANAVKRTKTQQRSVPFGKFVCMEKILAEQPPGAPAAPEDESMAAETGASSAVAAAAGRPQMRGGSPPMFRPVPEQPMSLTASRQLINIDQRSNQLL